MKTITFGIQKGGTGKTSISICVASQLAIQGYKVLYIDLDPQGNSSGWLLKDFDFEIADVLFQRQDVEKVIKQTRQKNLFILPTFGLGGDLRLYSETVASQKPYAIKQLLKNEKLQSFDYCIIDTSPSFSPLEKACYIASDEVIPILLLDSFSLDGLETFTSLIAELKKDYELHNAQIKTVVLNARDNRIQQHNIFLELYNNKIKINKVVIPIDQAFKKCQASNLLLQEFKETKKETLESLEELSKNIL